MKPLDRLRQEYKELLKYKHREVAFKNRTMCYNAMRLFCLDCSLVSKLDIEIMEMEVNQSF